MPLPARERTRAEWVDAYYANPDACPCEDHPAALCSTCKGACSCHWAESAPRSVSVPAATLQRVRQAFEAADRQSIPHGEGCAHYQCAAGCVGDHCDPECKALGEPCSCGVDDWNVLRGALRDLLRSVP